MELIGTLVGKTMRAPNNNVSWQGVTPAQRMQMQQAQQQERLQQAGNDILGAGGCIFFYVHPYLGKWSLWQIIFQMGWNHELV